MDLLNKLLVSRRGSDMLAPMSRVDPITARRAHAPGRRRELVGHTSPATIPTPQIRHKPTIERGGALSLTWVVATQKSPQAIATTGSARGVNSGRGHSSLMTR